MCKWRCACTDLVCGTPGPAVWMLFGSLSLPDHALHWSLCGQTPAAGNAILSALHSNQSFTPVFQPSESAWLFTTIWKEWMKASVLCWHLWIHRRVLLLDGWSCLAQLVADVGNFCGSEAVNSQNQNETSELKPRYETQTEHDKRLKWRTHTHTHIYEREPVCTHRQQLLTCVWYPGDQTLTESPSSLWRQKFFVFQSVSSHGASAVL